MDAEEVIRRARIRHEGLMARRQRLIDLERDLARWRDDLRILASDLIAKVQTMGTRAADVHSRIRAQIRDLEQEDTTIRLPALEPRVAPTERLKRPSQEPG